MMFENTFSFSSNNKKQYSLRTCSASNNLSSPQLPDTCFCEKSLERGFELTFSSIITLKFSGELEHQHKVTHKTEQLLFLLLNSKDKPLNYCYWKIYFKTNILFSS